MPGYLQHCTLFAQHPFDFARICGVLHAYNTCYVCQISQLEKEKQELTSRLDEVSKGAVKMPQLDQPSYKAHCSCRQPGVDECTREDLVVRMFPQ